MLVDLSTRHRQREWMDDPTLDPTMHRQALIGLRRINQVSRTAPSFWRVIRPMLVAGRTTRLLDIACGGGDVIVDIARMARRHGYRLEVSAADLSPIALQFAGQYARARHVPLTTFTHNALDGHWPGGPYDILINSLLLHHLDDKGVVTVLGHMRNAARCGLAVSDLLRSRWGWLAAHCGTRLLSRCPVVHVDGPRSVEGAFTFDELEALAEQAELPGFTLKRIWPARAMLCWWRT